LAIFFEQARRMLEISMSSRAWEGERRVIHSIWGVFRISASHLVGEYDLLGEPLDCG
jgi:hypothetical protein